MASGGDSEKTVANGRSESPTADHYSEANVNNAVIEDDVESEVKPETKTKPKTKTDKSVSSKTKSESKKEKKSSEKPKAVNGGEEKTERKNVGYTYRLHVENKNCKYFRGGFLTDNFNAMIKKKDEKFEVTKAFCYRDGKGRPKGVAEIIFNSVDAVQFILKSAKEGICKFGKDDEGNSIKVAVSEYKKKEFVQKPCRGIFFKGFDDDVSEKTLQKFGSQISKKYGKVNYINPIEGKGIGSFMFEDGESGKKLLEDYRKDKNCVKYKDTTIQVYPYKKHFGGFNKNFKKNNKNDNDD